MSDDRRDRGQGVGLPAALLLVRGATARVAIERLPQMQEGDRLQPVAASLERFALGCCAGSVEVGAMTAATEALADVQRVLAAALEPWWRCVHEHRMGLTMDLTCRTCERERTEVAAALSAHLAERDAARDRETALREAADNMPLNRPGQPYEHAAGWLRRRADLIARAASEGGDR